jgi:rare lipoprotein A
VNTVHPSLLLSGWNRIIYWGGGFFTTTLLLVACGHQPPVESPDEDGPGDILINKDPPDAVPKVEARSHYGNSPSYVVAGKRYHVLKSSRGYVERGIASWYGRKFHRRRTSSGEPYDMYAMTAAHKYLPLPTYVRVTNLENGRSAVLRVNDRGPFHGNRIIDLSFAAAKKLDIIRNGTGLVEVQAINPMQPMATQSTSLPMVSRDPDVYIQVGAFASRQNAETLRKRLKLHNLGEIEIRPSEEGAQTLYKVRIGPLATVDLADRTTERLNALGWQDYRVVIECQC